MPCASAAVFSSARRSRPGSKDEWSRRFHAFCFVGHIAYPSWCLDVITMYFCPAFFAAVTIAFASKADGLNCRAAASYSAMGMPQERLIHSAFRQTVPSARVYSPSYCE